MIALLLGALFGAVYGCCTVFRRKMPLFYRIVFYGVLTGLMGAVYTNLYILLWEPTGAGFHVGWFGYMGLFFFLFSAYYGALDSLVDDRSPAQRRYRLAAGLAALVFLVGGMWLTDGRHWLLTLLLPTACTLYFAVKHLVIPDVERGIIRVMRPFNGIVILLCLAMACSALFRGPLGLVGGIVAGLALALSLPLARKGVQKWFI